MAQHLMRSGVGVIGTFHQSAAEAEQMLTEADNLGHRLAFVQFDELVAVNLRAPYFLTQALLPLIKDGGRILNLSTALTHGVVTGMSAYAAVKGAVEVLTRYQAVELADRGIRVNTLTGGAAETDFGSGSCICTR